MNNPQIAGSPAPSPAKGKVGGPPKKMAGRGITKKTARKNAAAAKRGGGRPGGRGRGRNKTYDDPRVQAAYDRQIYLRDLYAEVASAIKPVLEDLADDTIKQLVDNPNAYQEVPEYDLIQRQLEERRDEVIRQMDREFNIKTTMATREYQLNTKISEKKYINSFDDVTEDFLNGCLKHTAILEHQRNEGLPVTYADPSYTFVQRPNEVVDEQGPYVVYRNGVKVPYPHLLDENKSAAANKGQVINNNNANKAKPTAIKRKADEQPDGQPDLKRPAVLPSSSQPDAIEDNSTPQPRHIKGLLAAEIEPDGEPESNAASPSPESDSKVEMARGKKDMPDLPNGVSEPDKWGVRTVNRRGPRANNRIILPPFKFDDDDIGFRDSTNDSSRKATRGTRGQFLNKPNSRNLHLDRVITTYDCLDHADGDLDPELVARHKLHPKLGLFLPDSINPDPDKPPAHVSGLAPVVVVTPNGATLQASRTVRGHNIDTSLREQASKEKMSSLLKKFCEDEEIPVEEVVTDEMFQRQQRLQSLRGPSPTNDLAREADHEDLPNDETSREYLDILAKAVALADSERQSHPPLKKPYDAVRDALSSPDPPPPARTSSDEDTAVLSLLADVATAQPRSQPARVSALGHKYDQHQNFMFEHLPPYPGEHRTNHPVEHYHPHHMDYHAAISQENHHSHQRDGPPFHENHHSHRRDGPLLDNHDVHQRDHVFEHTEPPASANMMIDPRLLGPSNHPPALPAFFQTALNPSPSHVPNAPPPAPVSIPLHEPQPHVPTGRNPFTSHGGTKGSPVLPPLRPARRETTVEPLHTGHTLPQLQQSPDFASHLGMIQSNSGIFYPPAPARPFHQSYTMVEPHPTLTIPPTHSSALGTPSGPPPLHIPQSSSVSPTGSLMMMPSSPTGTSGRGHRSSISSGSNNAKYRKIAAAPVPHNRPWNATGGAELRLAHYDHREAIKDYSADEPPPRSGPTTIRGWTNVNNVSKGRKGLKKEDSEEKESPSITTYINKWNPSDKGM
ncbi:hypothetical protein F5Y16DRAFT_16217 [Xylariaceae sp. FL0255]|nr:hypothetical protein F5Y16DRAFT_16217 [Xylariaceae sp. FL0255]